MCLQFYATEVQRKDYSQLQYLTYRQCDIIFAGEDWQKARKLQDKMKSNLENTRDRLDELGMCNATYFLQNNDRAIVIDPFLSCQP